MRKFVVLLFLLLPGVLLAQETENTNKKEKSDKTAKNAIKVNLSSLSIRNYHISYERQLAKKISFNLGFRVMPKGKLPFESTFENLGGGLDDESLQLGKFEIGNTAITPEFRFYLSKKAMKGFYIAPYGRWATFSLSLPFKYTYTDPNPAIGTQTKEATFTGKVNSFSGGIMFGTQFNLGKSLVLDIWWLGGHYGSSKGDLNFRPTTPLTTEEQNAVRNVLNDFDPKPFEFESSVNASGAQIKSTGPWAGLRGLGINLGIKF